jgi:hypothetical protein
MLDEKKIIGRDAKIMTSCMYNKVIVELSMAYSILFKKKKFFIKTNCHKIYISKTLTLIQNANLGLSSSESDDYVSRCLIKPT